MLGVSEGRGLRGKAAVFCTEASAEERKQQCVGGLHWMRCKIKPLWQKTIEVKFLKYNLGLKKQDFSHSQIPRKPERPKKNTKLIGGHQAQLVFTMLVVCIPVILACRFDASIKIIGVPFCILTL